MTGTGRELTPREVLADLFEQQVGRAACAPFESDPEKAAEIVIQHLTDAGFEIMAVQEARQLRDLVSAADILLSPLPLNPFSKSAP